MRTLAQLRHESFPKCPSCNHHTTSITYQQGDWVMLFLCGAVLIANIPSKDWEVTVGCPVSTTKAMKNPQKPSVP